MVIIKINNFNKFFYEIKRQSSLSIQLIEFFKIFFVFFVFKI